MASSRYMALINCKTPEEVFSRVREWTSNLSDHEHLVRSTILDIQADIELVLKQVVYQILKGVLFNGSGEEEYQKHRKQLEAVVRRLSFATVHTLLRPALDAFPADEFQYI